MVYRGLVLVFSDHINYSMWHAKEKWRLESLMFLTLEMGGYCLEQNLLVCNEQAVLVATGQALQPLQNLRIKSMCIWRFHLGSVSRLGRLYRRLFGSTTRNREVNQVCFCVQGIPNIWGYSDADGSSASTAGATWGICFPSAIFVFATLYVLTIRLLELIYFEGTFGFQWQDFCVNIY